MRSYDTATLGLLGSRRGLVVQRLVQIAARNRSTGLAETLALCTGVDDLTLFIDGEAVTYLAVGALLQADPITAGVGLDVRLHQLHLAAVSPEVEGLVKAYDTRFAPVKIHRAFFDPQTRNLAGTPQRVFRGMVNSIEFPTAEPGGNPSCTVEVASETRVLTRTLATKKSDDSHRARGGDRFRRYGDVSGVVPVYWGELRGELSAAPPPPPDFAGSSFDGRK